MSATIAVGPHMTTPALKTKLYLPPPRRDWVPRPRLIERLEQGLALGTVGFERKLTLISAPAGFGKTSLLSAWAQNLVHAAAPGSADEPQVRRVAWFSLDDGDNDPVQFWTYVIAALQTRYPALGALALAAIQSPPLPSIEVLLAGLINELTDIPGPLVLVMDDYHVISNPQVHEAVAFFLDHMPPHMRCTPA